MTAPITTDYATGFLPPNIELPSASQSSAQTCFKRVREEAASPSVSDKRIRLSEAPKILAIELRIASKALKNNPSLFATEAMSLGNHYVLSEKEVKRELENRKIDAIYEKVMSDSEKKLPILLGARKISKEASWGRDAHDFKSESLMLGSIEVGISESKGFRDTMEDRTLVTEIEVLGKKHPLFSVCDGHGTSEAASHVVEKLPALLKEKLEFFLKETNSTSLNDTVIYRALRSAHVTLDDLYKEDPSSSYGGTTVNTCFISEDHVYTANIGDSRAILINRAKKMALALSEDAKPTDTRHKQIIEFLGANVSCPDETWRISGCLSMGSALGKYRYPGVNPTVDISKNHLSRSSETIILSGCDGIWDVATLKNLLEIICNLSKDTSMEELARHVVLATIGSEDNRSLIALKIPPRGE